MDVPRTPPRRIPRALLATGAGVLVLLVSLGVSRLRPADPEVERGTLWIDSVRRGEMVRAVHGNGTLVPEYQRFVSALTAGRVDQVRVRPGAAVDSGTVLLVLGNPDVELQALDAERQLKLAEAELAGLRASLETARLAQESALAASRTELREAERGVAVAERLAHDGLSSAMEVERARDRAEEARTRAAADEGRLSVAQEALRAQLALRAADVQRLRAIARFQDERVASMTVRAGATGVVQELALQPGQWVQSGERLARIAAPLPLKAVVRVPEGDARDLTPGLPAVVDTRDGVVQAHVLRVDPAAQNGTVTADLALDGPLPRAARPDLNVEATVTLDRLRDALWTGRPTDVGEQGRAWLFRLEPGGGAARRVPVRIGRVSVDAVEVLDGLAAGDRVILSDMSRFRDAERVRLR